MSSGKLNFVFDWKNHAAFARAFARLEKDLRTSTGKG